MAEDKKKNGVSEGSNKLKNDIKGKGLGKKKKRRKSKNKRGIKTKGTRMGLGKDETEFKKENRMRKGLWIPGMKRARGNKKREKYHCAMKQNIETGFEASCVSGAAELREARDQK